MQSEIITVNFPCILVSPDGEIIASRVDDIEIYLLEKAANSNFPHSLIEVVAKRLDMTIKLPVDFIAKTRNGHRRTSFSYLDNRFGEPIYKQSEEPKSAKIIKFGKKAGKYNCNPTYEDDFIKKAKKDDVQPYYYTLEDPDMPAIDREIISQFLPDQWHSGAGNCDEYFQMHIKAVVEISYRLGYKPIFVENFSE